LTATEAQATLAISDEQPEIERNDSASAVMATNKKTENNEKNLRASMATKK